MNYTNYRVKVQYDFFCEDCEGRNWIPNPQAEDWFEANQDNDDLCPFPSELPCPVCDGKGQGTGEKWIPIGHLQSGPIFHGLIFKEPVA